MTHRAEPFDTIFVALSRIGSFGTIWLLFAVALAVGRRRLYPFVFVGAAVLVAEVVSMALKVAIGRQRPYLVVPEPEPLLRAHLDLSLPSGHAATAFAGAVALSVLVRQRAAIIALLALAAATAWSRVYVGVHYPSDILLGALVGIAAAAATAAVAARVRALRTPAAAPPRSPPGPPPG